MATTTGWWFCGSKGYTALRFLLRHFANERRCLMSHQWDVSASWYDCNPRSGACGTCDSTKSGLAYPYLAGHPPNYARCQIFSQLPQHSCGDIIPVFGRCSGGLTWVNVPIVDHGPGAACANDCPPCYVPDICRKDPNHLNIYRLVDLTRATFITVTGRPLSEGLAFVSVKP